MQESFQKLIRNMVSFVAKRRWTALAVAATLAVPACGPTSTDPGDDPGDTPDPPASYDHNRAAGASARHLLAGSDYDRLVVQVQYVGGFAPTQEGLTILRDFLEARLNKPAGITIQTPQALQIQTQSAYSAQDIRALEQQHRTVYTEGKTLALYLLFVNGEYSAQSNVLGIAYNNTSMAIFGETIRAHTGGPLQPPTGRVEGTVANHEVGHLLGLVNNGSAMQTEHQDEPNGHHCDNENCLMYFAVRTSDFISNLLGGVPNPDQNCIDDLRANGGA